MSVTNGVTLFPNNPNNDYYEKDAEASRSAICSVETKICSLSAIIPAILIGSQILKKLNLLDLSSERLSTITTLGTVATVAILLGGLCITRFQLTQLSLGPPLDPSNSLTRAQVQQFLTIAKIKDNPPQITHLISHLEEVNRDTGYSRTYITPTQREDFKQIEYVMTKKGIIDILERAKIIKSQRENEWNLIWKKEADESKKKSRPSFSSLGRFSIEETDSGEATIKFIKYPLNLVKIDHLICLLEKAIKGFDEDAAIVDVGDDARFLLQILKLEPIQKRPEVPGLRIPMRHSGAINLNLTGVKGSMRSSPTIKDFDSLSLEHLNESNN